MRDRILSVPNFLIARSVSEMIRRPRETLSPGEKDEDPVDPRVGPSRNRPAGPRLRHQRRRDTDADRRAGRPFGPESGAGQPAADDFLVGFVRGLLVHGAAVDDERGTLYPHFDS